jgi:hypothetical protein
MAKAAIVPVTINMLDDWSRLYQLDFADSFVEFSAPTPPSIVGTPTITADSGITATYEYNAGGVVYVRLSGGTAGNAYNVSVGVVLSTDDELSMPVIVNVAAPGTGGIFAQTLSKLPGWERHYLFPFGKVFSEFNTGSSVSIVSADFTCQPAADSSVVTGSAVASGTSVIVFVTGGNAGEVYQVRCTAVTSGGDTLSIPGILAD